MKTELPEPEFKLGQAVSVALNEHNHTPHTGTIARVIWHYKDGCFNYYLEAGGKKISKRYFARDLRPASNNSFKADA